MAKNPKSSIRVKRQSEEGSRRRALHSHPALPQRLVIALRTRSSPMKVSFSLKGKAAAKPAGDAPSLKRTAAFASLDDDEPVDAAPTATGDNKGKVAANKQFIAQSVEMSKAAKKRLEAEKKVDATVFEYDEIYDKMQEAKLKQKEAKEADAKERKVSARPACAPGRVRPSADMLKMFIAQVH